MSQREAGFVEVEVRADLNRYSRNMDRAEREARQFNRRAQRGLNRTTRAMAALGAATKAVAAQFAAMAGAFLGGTGIAAIALGARAAAREFDALAKAADTRGLNTDFYQTLQLAAEEAGVSQKLLNSSLTAFAKRVGEARADTGPLASTLKKMDEQLFEAVKTSNSQEEALRLVAEAMRQSTDAAERAGLASAAFSRAGVELVRVFVGGSQALDETAEKARELGIVVERRLLDQMQEVNNEFGVATRVIDLQFKQAVVAAAPAISRLATALADASRSARLFVESFRDPSDASTFSLERRAEQLRRELDQLAVEEGLNFEQRLFLNLLPAFERVGAVLGATNSLRDAIIGLFSDGADAVTEGSAEIRARLQQELENINQILIGRGFAEGTSIVPLDGQTDDPRDPRDTTSRANDRARAVQQLLQLEMEFLRATNRTQEALKLQSQQELQRFQELLQAKLITQEEFEKARQQLAAITAKRMEELNNDALKGIDQIGGAISSNLEGAFREFIETGKLNFDELTRKILADIATIAFRINVLQPLFGGGLGGQGGGLFASLFQSGGIAGSSAAPKREVPPAIFAGAPRLQGGGRVLRNGEVPAILHAGERVIPASQVRDGQQTRTVVNVINNSGEEVREERRREGGSTEVVDIVIGSVRERMGRGDFDSVMGGRFGIRPRTRRT